MVCLDIQTIITFCCSPKMKVTLEPSPSCAVFPRLMSTSPRTPADQRFPRRAAGVFASVQSSAVSEVPHAIPTSPDLDNNNNNNNNDIDNDDNDNKLVFFLPYSRPSF